LNIIRIYRSQKMRTGCHSENFCQSIAVLFHLCMILDWTKMLLN